MRDFKEINNYVKNLISDKLKLTPIIKEGIWDDKSETFKENNKDYNCYKITIEKNLQEGNLIKTINQFSEIDTQKSKFKSELIEILKAIRNKGCEVHISQSSTTYKIYFEIYVIRTDDLDQWYVPISSSEWYDKNGAFGYLSKRYYISNNEMSDLKSKGWIIRKGEEVLKDMGGYKDPLKYYNRRWIERINSGFYFVNLDSSELKPDKSGYVKDPKIAFIKKPDDYFLCFFNIEFNGSYNSLPDCLIGPRMGNRSGAIFKCDQVDGLIKCIEDYQL